MGLKIKEEVLGVENLLGANSAQTVFQGTVELPASAGKIGRVVWVKGNPVVNETKVEEDKVVVDGVVDLQLVYVTEAEEDKTPTTKQIKWQGAIPFSHFVEVIGAEPSMRGEAKVSLLSIDWEVRPDQRTLDVDALTLVTVKVYQKQQFSVVTSASITPPKKLIVNDVPINNGARVSFSTAKQRVTDNLELPEGTPIIGTVLDLAVRPNVSEIKLGEGAVTVSGGCDVELIYVTEGSIVDHVRWENKVPYSLELKNNRINPDVKVIPVVQVDVDYQLGEGNTKLALDLVFTVKADVIQPVHARAVTELSSPNGDGIEVRRETVRFDNLIGEKTQQSTAQGVIELGDNYPPIREILSSTGVVHVNDYRIDEDKVILEGTVDVELSYLAHMEEEGKPLYHGVFRNAIPIQQTLAIGGVQPGMTAQFDVVVKSVRPDLINRETIELDVTYKSTVQVTQAVEEEVVIEALEVGNPDPNPPSITYVVVQPGDTLWKLSKRYHTAMDAIVSSNSWLRETKDSPLVSGTKLCIPRKPLVKQ